MSSRRGVPGAPAFREASPPTLLGRLSDVIRQLLGVPDYDRYLEHVRAHHPGETPLSREEFTRRRMDERYSRPGSRCC
jgi:uncharacterized short protein YbdD (DUF466 family)